MIGYLSLYFKVAGKKETYFAEIHTDFNKPISEHFFTDIKENIKNCYTALFKGQDEILSVEYCTREEYEANRQEAVVHAKWSEKNNS